MPGGPATTDSTSVYRKLREEILRTRLQPGEALNEADLMKRFGIGRTPLRDALHLLDHEGLVEIWPRRGTFVSQVTVSDLQQVFELRVAIEPILAGFVIGRCTPRHVADLQALIQRARNAHGSGSDASIDSEFHGLLLSIAANSYLRDTYERLLDASLRLHYLTDCGMETEQQQVATLEAIASAIASRDADRLTEMLVNHVAEFRDRVTRALFTARTATDGGFRDVVRDSRGRRSRFAKQHARGQ